MPECSFSSLLDTYRKPKAKPDKDDSPTGEESGLFGKKEPAKPEAVFTEQENTRLKGYLVEAKKREQSGDIKAALELYTKYKQEFLAIKNRGKSIETLSPEYIEALSEIFKGETLDTITLPKPEELTDEYFSKMYPETQRDEDTAKGLVSYRPSWWKDKADASIVGSAEEIWGQAFIRSMQSEATQLQDSLLLTESIQKPNYTGGSQQYGSKEGADATLDPLLPIIREVFGEEANRFNLSWDQITNDLLPKVKEKITSSFTAKGLPIPNFDVILTPALVSNIQTTLNHPENSQTTTYEWSSTPLLKQDNTDSGLRLVVGYSGRGGAGYVYGYHRGGSWDYDGFRLSVVFKKH